MLRERSRNRGIGRDGYDALTRSGRIGPKGRSFHFRVAPATRGGAKMRYAHRLDGERIEELESRDQILDVDAFERMAAELEHDLAGRRKELPKEHQAAAYTIEMELPRELSPAGRAWVAQTLAETIQVGAFGGSDNAGYYPTTWAIHGTNAKGADQPHAHLVILAGPNGERPIAGLMKLARESAADLINEAGRREGLDLRWHGGTLADTGIHRAPRRRVHMALYQAREDRDAGKPLSRTRARLAAAADRLDAIHGKPTKDDRLKAAAAQIGALTAHVEALAARPPPGPDLRDPGGALSPDLHAELERRGLTTRRRTQAQIERLERELVETREQLEVVTRVKNKLSEQRNARWKAANKAFWEERAAQNTRQEAAGASQASAVAPGPPQGPETPQRPPAGRNRGRKGRGMGE